MSREATAADTLAQAVLDILPVSPEAAVKLAVRLLDLLDPAVPALARHLVVVADAHLADGRLPGARALLRESLLRPLPRDVAVALRTRLVHVLVASGRIGEAVTVAKGGSPEPVSRGAGCDETRAALVWARSLRGTKAPRASAARTTAARVSAARTSAARRRAEPSRSVVSGAMVTSTLADSAWRGGDADRAMRLSRRAVNVAGDSAPPVWRMIARLAHARRLLSAGRYTEAGGHIERAADELSRPGASSPYSPALDITRAEWLMRTGSPEEALELAGSALNTARETDAGLLVPLAHAALAEIHLRIGDLGRSRRHLEMSRKLLGGRGPRLWPVHPEWTRARLVAAVHGPRQTVRLLAAEGLDHLTRRSLFLDEPGAAVWLTRLGIAAGDDRLVRRAGAAVERLARRNPRFHRLAVVARHTRGLRDSGEGDARAEDVAALWWAAAQHPDRWDRAGALEDLAVRLAAPPAPDIAEATRRLRAALHAFERIGAVRDGERVRGRLRRLGVEPVPARRERSLWSDFSETECVIALLVSQGLTNHQIAGRISLSTHTVNYHLRKMFRKVGVSSRVELACLANSVTEAVQVRGAGLH